MASIYVKSLDTVLKCGEVVCTDFLGVEGRRHRWHFLWNSLEDFNSLNKPEDTLECKLIAEPNRKIFNYMTSPVLNKAEFKPIEIVNLLARMKHSKKAFSMSINLIRNGEKEKKNNQWLSMLSAIQSHKEKEKKSKKLRLAFYK